MEMRRADAKVKRYTGTITNTYQGLLLLAAFFHFGKGVILIATTRLMPLHVGKGRDVSTAIADIIDYVENPRKTDFGKFIYGYECDTRIADAEFLLSKRQYLNLTGRDRARMM